MAGKRASNLPKKTNARRNTKTGRKAMAPSSFALPKQKKYRIDDAAHARNALARVAQKGSPAEKATVRAAVKRRFPSIQVAGSSKPPRRSSGRRARRG
jgi:hypothetical protein